MRYGLARIRRACDRKEAYSYRGHELLGGVWCPPPVALWRPLQGPENASRLLASNRHHGDWMVDAPPTTPGRWRRYGVLGWRQVEPRRSRQWSKTARTPIGLTSSIRYR